MTLRSLSSSQMYCYYSSNFLSPFSPLNYSYMYVELLDVLLSQWLSSHLFSHCGSFYQFCTAVSSSLLVHFLPCIICFLIPLHFSFQIVSFISRSFNLVFLCLLAFLFIFLNAQSIVTLGNVLVYKFCHLCYFWAHSYRLFSLRVVFSAFCILVMLFLK